MMKICGCNAQMDMEQEKYMKYNIVSDLETLMRLFLDMRKARKRGIEIKLEKKCRFLFFSQENFAIRSLEVH